MASRRRSCSRPAPRRSPLHPHASPMAWPLSVCPTRRSTRSRRTSRRILLLRQRSPRRRERGARRSKVPQARRPRHRRGKVQHRPRISRVRRSSPAWPVTTTSRCSCTPVRHVQPRLRPLLERARKISRRPLHRHAQTMWPTSDRLAQQKSSISHYPGHARGLTDQYLRDIPISTRHLRRLGLGSRSACEEHARRLPPPPPGQDHVRQRRDDRLGKIPFARVCSRSEPSNDSPPSSSSPARSARQRGKDVPHPACARGLRLSVTTRHLARETEMTAVRFYC